MRFGYTIIYVPDVLATVAFYQNAFGLVCRFKHENQYSEMDTGATALAFVQEEFAASSVGHFSPNRLKHQPSGVEVGFVVKDVQMAFDHAVGAGAEPYVHPLKKPWGQTVSYVRDLNGFLIELCSAMDG